MSFVFSRRFMPLFITQFFGAVNDNFLKNAMLIMITYQMGRSGSESGMLCNLAAGLFILPYFLFSSLAGQLSDRYDKAVFCRWIKLWEVCLMLLAGVGFRFRSLELLMIILFLMGAQSTFFSPAKYALLPTHLKPEELLSGNAWISGGTYLAILCGVIGGGVAIYHGELISAAALIIMAVIGLAASCRIPTAPPVAGDRKINFNLFAETWNILVIDIWRNKVIRKCVYSVTIFWLAGSLLITLIPLFTKSCLGGNEMVCTFFFVLFSVGVGVGAAAANWILGGKTQINKKCIASILLMGSLTFYLAYLAGSLPYQPQLRPTAELLKTFLFYRVSLLLLLIAVCGGIWSVPLQAVMQKTAEPGKISRIIAGNNIVNSFYMAAGAVVSGLLLKMNVGLQWNFAGLAAVIIYAALFTLPLVKGADRSQQE